MYGIDSILISWTISSSVGLTDIDQYYELPNINGTYSFVLDIFCMQKATDNIFTFIDNYYFHSSSLGTEDITFGESLSILIYPNPSNNGMMTIKCEGQINAIDVYDMTGRLVTSDLILSDNKIDASQLSMGNYMVHIETEFGMTVKQVSIIK